MKLKNNYGSEYPPITSKLARLEKITICIIISLFLFLLFTSCTINLNIASDGQPVILNIQDTDQIKSE
jgi:hypothetical protein